MDTKTLSRKATRNALRTMAQLGIKCSPVKPQVLNAAHVETRKAVHEVCELLTPVFGAPAQFSRNVADEDRIGHAIWDLPRGRLMVYAPFRGRTQIVFLRAPHKINKFGVRALAVFGQVKLGGITIVSDGRSGDGARHCCYVRECPSINVVIDKDRPMVIQTFDHNSFIKAQWLCKTVAQALDFAVALAKISH